MLCVKSNWKNRAWLPQFIYSTQFSPCMLNLICSVSHICQSVHHFDDTRPPKSTFFWHILGIGYNHAGIHTCSMDEVQRVLFCIKCQVLSIRVGHVYQFISTEANCSCKLTDTAKDEGMISGLRLYIHPSLLDLDLLCLQWQATGSQEPTASPAKQIAHAEISLTTPEVQTLKIHLHTSSIYMDTTVLSGRENAFQTGDFGGALHACTPAISRAIRLNIIAKIYQTILIC